MDISTGKERAPSGVDIAIPKSISEFVSGKIKERARETKATVEEVLVKDLDYLTKESFEGYEVLKSNVRDVFSDVLRAVGGTDMSFGSDVLDYVAEQLANYTNVLLKASLKFVESDPSLSRTYFLTEDSLKNASLLLGVPDTSLPEYRMPFFRTEKLLDFETIRSLVSNQQKSEARVLVTDEFVDRINDAAYNLLATESLRAVKYAEAAGNTVVDRDVFVTANELAYIPRGVNIDRESIEAMESDVRKSDLRGRP